MRPGFGGRGLQSGVVTDVMSCVVTGYKERLWCHEGRCKELRLLWYTTGAASKNRVVLFGLCIN